MQGGDCKLTPHCTSAEVPQLQSAAALHDLQLRGTDVAWLRNRHPSIISFSNQEQLLLNMSKHVFPIHSQYLNTLPQLQLEHSAGANPILVYNSCSAWQQSPHALAHTGRPTPKMCDSALNSSPR